MKQSTIRLGYLESICQVLALETENLVMEHHTIWQLFQEADETLFLQLAPHLFTTKSTQEPFLAEPLESSQEGFQYFKHLVEQGG